ncbi:MerR family transcriptional regulator [Streptomyces sp. NPDC050211]|uniref:MerR family transcriptional regulator n=1 Tax=Streptomyces sp. NPDC050211 TaxID=3154932 RepID=UPI003444C36E
MRISELARQADVTTKAVRYYESLGLITPERLANGYRNYDEDDVRLVREIRTLHLLGIPSSAPGRSWSVWRPDVCTPTTVRPRWRATGRPSTSSPDASRH